MSDRPARPEPWHEALTAFGLTCLCDPAYSERGLQDDRCYYHRLIDAVDDLRAYGWTVEPPNPLP